MATPGAPELSAEAVEQDVSQVTNEVVSEVASDVLPDLLSLAVGSPLPASRSSKPPGAIGTGEGQTVGLGAERERLQQMYRARATIGQERAAERMRALAEVHARFDKEDREIFEDLDGEIGVLEARLRPLRQVWARSKAGTTS